MNPTALRSDKTTADATETVPPPAQPPLMERVVQGAHETIDRLAERAAPHVQRVQESVSGANEMLHERADQARELGTEWVDALRGTVRAHPVAAVATALAAGLLLARLLQQPSR